MKRKSAERPKWKFVTAKRLTIAHLDRPEFCGTAALLQIDAVSRPHWTKLRGAEYRSTRVVDAGYSWLLHYPQGEHYALATIFDDRAQIVQWYIDICRRNGLDQRGVPYCDDLYLDIIMVPSGGAHLVDQDELEVALQRGDIGPGNYALARYEARKLMGEIARGTFTLPKLALAHRDWLLSLPVTLTWR